MQLYEYKCGCRLTASTTSKEPPVCRCGRVMVREWTKNIIFKAPGFYSTDSRSAG